ncbi:MAG: bi-domain-containing oxidoreductase [Proteobacteria bacterium]|nr:bi-domain-containing oxidoreductase [Pseudomonadota bacterium]
MKQILQSAKSGELELVEVPAPAVAPGHVLVRNHYSVVSPGTEKMAMDFARKSMLGKARSRPDLVKQVTRKLRQEGPLPTYRAVMTRLEAPQPLGYACAGVIEAVGDGVQDFAPGDRVACAGAGYANHAEWVNVPENLVVAVPDGVPLEKAAFATLGAIALQGVRVTDPTLGEIGAVIGLGLIGQLSVQLLAANGCRLLAIDLDPERIEQAVAQGAEWGGAPKADHEAWKAAATGGHGADFALVTAASESSAPISLAAELCRLKGRVGAVGATAMDLDRRSFYEKELELRMSMSYGPGRYDRRYEELGLDYPLAYVRWTERRNLEAFLALIASGRVDPGRLQTRTVPFSDAEAAYEALAKGERPGLALLFEYEPGGEAERTLALAPARTPVSGEVGVAFLGAGNYAKGVLLPAVKAAGGVRPTAIVTSTGPSARRTAEKFGYAQCGTDASAVLRDAAVDLVFVATQHDSHAALAEAALRAGKAVWLEKPAGLTPAEVEQLAEAVRETGGFLGIGYNRRFSSHARVLRDAFSKRRGPMALRYTVAAGATPAGTWITDPKVGGGRHIGEICHFVDACGFLIGTPPVSVYARALGRDAQVDDSVVLSLGYIDGSVATIEYLANAASGLPKERFELSADGRTASSDNYKVTKVLGGLTHKTVNQDKGQATAVAEVIEAVRSGAGSPFSLEDWTAVSAVTFAIARSIQSGRPIDLQKTRARTDAP